MLTRQDRIAGGLVGLLVGDALGVPYEFNGPERLPPEAQIEFDPPAGFRRSHTGTPPGTWSDDGAQALCLLDSLLECGHFDAEDFGRRLVRWLRQGYMAVDDRVYDVGLTTRRALEALMNGTPALMAGPAHEQSNGNGSLMRVLPLALWHRGSDVELVADARAQSCVTHRHPRSQLCCALYCLWARRILEDRPTPWADAVRVLRGMVVSDPESLLELDGWIHPDDPAENPGSGYVVDCLLSARDAVERGPYETAVKVAIRMGHDTDTTACVAGGIAGLRDGLGAIPERWRLGVRGKAVYQPLLDALLARG